MKEKVRVMNERSYDYEESFYNKVDEFLESSEGHHVKDVLVKGFEHVLSHVDEEIKVIEKEVGLNKSCEIGCAHCCYFPIMVTKLEVKLMLQYIEQLPLERKEKMMEHFQQYVKTFAPQLEQIKDLDYQKDVNFKHQYKKLNLPCMLLDEQTNTCLAYEVRPTPCRTYMNYVPPKVCSEQHVPKEPISYEFLHNFYVQGMDEIIQTILEVVDDTELGFSYPADVMEVQYLPLLLKEELINRGVFK